MGRELILIQIIEFKKWKPLSRTHRLDELWRYLGEEKAAALMGEFALFLLNYYQSLIINTIKNQKFKKPYTPLSVEYALFKKRKHLKPGFWQEYGDLQENLTHWRESDGTYMIGFKPDTKHSVNGADQTMIANVLERGSEKMHVPARPLFTPIAAAIRKGIIPFFEKFLRVKHPELIQYI